MQNWPNKDPDSVLDYGFNWTAWLGEDTIATSQWLISPSGSLVEDFSNNTTTETTIWLSGGTVGVKYLVTNRITTAGGRTVDRTVSITVAEQ